MDLKNKIIYFSDLDDSLFQTKRKSSEGIYIATKTKDEQKISYYTKEQKEFLEHIMLDQSSLLIPITARTKDQFERTHLHLNNLTPIYSNYYGGCITINKEKSKAYDALIKPDLKKALKIGEKIISSYYKKKIELINVDRYYYVIKSIEEFDKIVELFSSACVQFDVYKNEKTITLLPSIINKKNAVQFLCDVLEPKFTIGLGDSKSDLDFLNFCNFKMISKIGELNEIINGKD